MHDPLITVYITNHNYERYIEKSIQSVLNQTLQDFELFIIDDGSTDNSKEIIEKYRNYDGVSIIYQQNKGLNVTNNVAMRASNGKYLIRLDADDFLEPEALEVMSNVLEDDEELGLVFPDYYYVDKQGNRTGEQRRHNFEKEVSLYDQPAHGACTMIRLAFLKKLGGYNENFTCQDGYDLWIKFVFHYKVTNVNRPLFSYRRHGENLTSNEDKILQTRRAINQAFVNEYIGTSNALAVIPVRNTKIKSQSWPLYNDRGKTVIERKIDTCLEANNISGVVITSADHEILDFSRNQFSDNERVIVIERPPEYAELNQTLNATVKHAIKHAKDYQFNFSSVMTVSLDFPFVDSSLLDDMVHTHLLFKSDSVLSVRPDNRKYYQHTGHTLQPILEQDKYTKIEREALYKGAGGLMLISLESFHKSGKIPSGVIAHVVVDEKTAFGIFSDFELNVYNALTAEAVNNS